MSEPNVIWYQKRMELFDDLDESELQELQKLLRHDQIKRGEPVPAQARDTVYFLKEGRVKLSRVTGEGRPITLDILEAGDIFGEIAGSDSSRGDTLAEALEDCFVCTMRRGTFQMLLKARPELALRVVELVDERRQRFEMRLDEMLYQDVPTRLARVLLRLADRFGTVGTAGIRLRLGLTHEELSNLIATTRESVSKYMADFRTRGLIDYGPGQILPQNLPGLQEQARYE